MNKLKTFKASADEKQSSQLDASDHEVGEEALSRGEWVTAKRKSILQESDSVFLIKLLFISFGGAVFS